MLYRLGVCRYLLSSISTAVGLFNEALALAERSGLPSDTLRLNIFAWRSRCYRRQRDYEAAREDVERALELAEAMQDARALGEAYFQASLLAERDGHWVLARTYAEKAKTQYEELADRANVGRLLNNLGGLEFLLGKPEQAVEHLKHAFSVALEIGRDEDAAKAVSSLAQVHLRTGDHQRAEEQALHALEIIGEPRGHARRDRQRAARARARAARAGPPRRGRVALAEAEDAFAQIVIDVAPRCRVGRPGRSRDQAWRRTARSGALPARRRNAPGLPVLREGRCSLWPPRSPSSPPPPLFSPLTVLRPGFAWVLGTVSNAPGLAAL